MLEVGRLPPMMSGFIADARVFAAIAVVLMALCLGMLLYLVLTVPSLKSMLGRQTGTLCSSSSRDIDKRIKELEANEQAMNDAHCKLMDKLDATKPKWISVNDRLPEEGEDVLYTNGEVICLGSWGVEYGDSDHSNEEHAYWCDEWGHNDYEMDEVTHWMLLPPPPTDDSKETEKEDK